jgi:transcriptional regulator with XRE-family HTH domain
VVGVSQQRVAERLAVQPSTLSNWENGTRAISVGYQQLDAAVGAEGVLAELLWAFGTRRGLDPHRSWTKIFPGESGPVWAWFRSPSPKVKLEGEWGVARIDHELNLGANGLFMTLGASVAESALVIQLSEPGWVDFGRGELPPDIPLAPVLPAAELARRSTATGPFMQLFIGSIMSKLTSRPWSREVASFAVVAPKTIASFVSGFSRSQDVETPDPWPPLPDGIEAVDRLRFARLRRARGLSLVDTASRLAAITGTEVGKDTLRRFETGVGQPHDPLLPAALDHVLGANGHLGMVEIRSDRGSGSVRLPPYWYGPVWIAVEGPGTEGRVRVRFGDWYRQVRGTLPMLVAIQSWAPETALRISADSSITWKVGLGRRVGAVSIDQNWVPASIGAAQRALSETERAIMRAFGVGETVSS